MQAGNFLSPPKVAKLLGVAVEQVHAFIARGELKAFNLSLHDRPRWKIAEEDLNAFLESRANKSAKEQEAKSRRARRVMNSETKQYFT